MGATFDQIASYSVPVFEEMAAAGHGQRQAGLQLTGRLTIVERFATLTGSNKSDFSVRDFFWQHSLIGFNRSHPTLAPVC